MKTIDTILEDMENWKPVRGFEDLYLVSRNGEIYSTRRKKKLKTFDDQRGYSVLKFWKEKLYHIRLSRLVAEHFIPNPKKYKIVNHINGKTRDDRVENLEWCSQSYNIIHYNDKLRKKRKYFGTSWHKRKNKWQAQIMKNYKNYHIGYYKTREEATLAYIDFKNKNSYLRENI